jgi:hypothetical protein
MPTNYTAIWAAVAASFSALSAFLVMRIQKQNLMESVRPDLLPMEWVRPFKMFGAVTEIIGFRKIRNVGRGTAFNIAISGKYQKMPPDGGLPTVAVNYCSLLLVGVNEMADINGEVWIHWNQAETSQGIKAVMFTMTIDYTDVRDVLYHTEYRVVAFHGETTPRSPAASNLAPGLSSNARHTTKKPMWRVNMEKKIQNVSKKTGDEARAMGMRFGDKARAIRKSIAVKFGAMRQAIGKRLRRKPPKPG